jgi:hypothetical protein
MLAPAAGLLTQLSETETMHACMRLWPSEATHSVQVVLLFPRQFWPKDADMFGRIAETTAERGEFFLFYSYADLAGEPAAPKAPSPIHMLVHSVITAKTIHYHLGPAAWNTTPCRDSWIPLTSQNLAPAKWAAITVY